MICTPSVRDSTTLAWFKSSYSSSGDGNDCVEVTMTPSAMSGTPRPLGARGSL